MTGPEQDDAIEKLFDTHNKSVAILAQVTTTAENQTNAVDRLVDKVDGVIVQAARHGVRIDGIEATHHNCPANQRLTPRNVGIGTLKWGTIIGLVGSFFAAIVAAIQPPAEEIEVVIERAVERSVVSVAEKMEDEDTEAAE